MRFKLRDWMIALAFLAMPGICFADDFDDSEQQDDAEIQDDAANIEVPEEEVVVEDHRLPVHLFAKDKVIQVKIVTSAGDVMCDLYAGLHPVTVVNFVSLAKGTPGWTNLSGKNHRDPYYTNIKFAQRSKGAYVISGLRPEGVNFVITDERCLSHEPKAGAIMMLQDYPGQASVQFMILGKDMPAFKGMYTVFGQCSSKDVIQTLTKQDAVLERVEVL